MLSRTPISNAPSSINVEGERENSPFFEFVACLNFFFFLSSLLFLFLSAPFDKCATIQIDMLSTQQRPLTATHQPPLATAASAGVATQSEEGSRSSQPTRLDVPAMLIQTYFNEKVFFFSSLPFEFLSLFKKIKKKGEECTRRWVRGKFLGKGGFAEVYDITDADTGEHYAGKIVAKASLLKKKAKEKLRMEIRVHKSLQHRHIVGFVSYFEVDDFYVIVLELCANKSMMELLRSRKRLIEPEARYYLAQMVSALKYMHDKRIIHRDLKLGNIFLNSALEVKIGDFGLATQLTYDDERKKTICGTPNYIAPEVLHGGEVGHSYQVDIWSLGVVLYTWIVGKPPFETADVKTTYRRIRDSIYSFPDRVRVSDEAKDLIKRMLQKNPDARPSLDEVAQHPFFTNHITPTALPSTALVMEPKLPDLTKRIASAPALTRHYEADLQNAMVNGVPSTAALHVPAPLANVKSPARHRNVMGGSPARALRPASNPGGGGNPKREVGVFAEGKPKTPRSAGQTTHQRENIVDLIHATLVAALDAQAAENASQAKPLSIPTGQPAPEPVVWIQRWGDYSAKYGLAYQYNTGSFGAYFNDSTIMVMDPDGQRVDYVERQKGREVKDSYDVDAYPADLKKKVNLLQYFTNYLPAKSPAVGLVRDAKEAAGRAAGQPLVYVRKWLKTRHAFFFRLTDNTLQVNFTDNTGVILSAKGTVVTYIDKKNQMLTLWLAEVWTHEQKNSISSRLHYIRDMLASLISKRGQPEEGN